jgi:hypothetical protein
MLLMEKPHLVQIVSVPISCSGEIKDSWREVAKWAGDQLHALYGDAVQTEYYDLFDEDCPDIPHPSQLPVVLIDGQLLSNGGKISVPAIRKKLEEPGQ